MDGWMDEWMNGNGWQWMTMDEWNDMTWSESSREDTILARAQIHHCWAFLNKSELSLGSCALFRHRFHSQTCDYGKTDSLGDSWGHLTCKNTVICAQSIPSLAPWLLLWSTVSTACCINFTTAVAICCYLCGWRDDVKTLHEHLSITVHEHLSITGKFTL